MRLTVYTVSLEKKLKKSLKNFANLGTSNRNEIFRGDYYVDFAWSFQGVLSRHGSKVPSQQNLIFTLATLLKISLGFQGFFAQKEMEPKKKIMEARFLDLRCKKLASFFFP